MKIKKGLDTVEKTVSSLFADGGTPPEKILKSFGLWEALPPNLHEERRPSTLPRGAASRRWQ